MAILLDDHDAHAITRAGFERLREELRVLASVRRDELANVLRQAREDGGDLADNAAIAEAIDAQQRLERRVDELEALLAHARVVTPPAQESRSATKSRRLS